jgi:hypothetical protein
LAALESQLIISADDRTAAAFASVQGKLAQLQSTIAAMDKVGSTPALANAGAFAGPGAALAEHAEAVEKQTAAIEAQTKALDSTSASLAKGSDDILTFAAKTLGLYKLLETVQGGVQQAFERQHEATREQAAGMTPAELEDAQKLGGQIAGEYPSIQQSSAMAMARNTRSVFGSYEDAAKFLPELAKLFVVAQATHPHESQEDLTAEFEQLIKGIEIKGATQHPEEFHEMVEGMAKGLNVFGDTLRMFDYYAMIKYAKAAAIGLSPDFMVSVAPSIAQRLRGSTAGRAFTDFDKAIVGGHLEHEGFEELLNLGLLKEEDVDRTKTGEIKGIKPGHHIAGADLAAHNQFEWVQRYAMPALAARNVTDQEDVREHLDRVF